MGELGEDAVDIPFFKMVQVYLNILGTYSGFHSSASFKKYFLSLSDCYKDSRSESGRRNFFWKPGPNWVFDKISPMSNFYVNSSEKCCKLLLRPKM